MELVQHQVINLVHISFLITGHMKFALDRLFYFFFLVLGVHTITVMSSTLMSYVVAIAVHLGTAVKETGVNVLHWR